MIDSEEKLVRAIGLREIVALTINGIIGAGIFAVPAEAARLLGIASPLAFAIAGLFAAIVVLCFAELGARFDRTGGAYLYAYEAFGGLPAFLVGWLYLLARLTSIGALSNALAGFVGFFTPLNGANRSVFLVLLLFALGFANYRGVRLSTRTINVLTVAKILPLMIFISVGMFFVNWNAFSQITLPELKPLNQTLLLAIFAFSGFEVIAVPGAEIINTRRNVPLGILLGTGITIVIYLCIQTVAVGTFPGLAASQTPLSSAAQSFMGRRGAVILGIAAICSTIGTLMSLLLVAPRILFAMSLNGQMPAPFSRVHSQYRTPSLAILFCTVLVCGVALSGRFTVLATLSAIARVMTYIGSAAALVILRKKDPQPDKFQAPGGFLIPGLTVALCFFLLTAATRAHWTAALIALACGLLLYRWSIKRK